tara:strand:- start:4573 stop:5331 length:759 start_codon:yes stop_codon:yes gene_type:complete
MAVKCTELLYTPINALSFRITGGTHLLTTNKKNNIITSIDDSEGRLISLGTTIEIKKIKYKVNIIEEIIVNTTKYYKLSTAKKTKASVFIAPMLPGNKNLYFWNKLFVNCFIQTSEDKNCIALLYRWSSNPLYIKFEKALSKFKNFRRRYDPSPNYVMFVFDVPQRHIRNYKKFVAGKYSEFSKAYKIDILEFHDADIEDEIGQIIFRSDRRRKAMEKRLGTHLPENSELLSIINIEDETYNPEIYKLKKLI